MTVRIGLCQWEVARGGLDAWAARLDEDVSAAVAEGAELLVLPEYAPLEASFVNAPDLEGELARALVTAPAVCAAAAEIARRHGVWLLAGSLPVAGRGRVVNRAPLISPDGMVAMQDKHVPTRFEAEQWEISPGEPPSVFETPWGKIGIAVCFDAEFPTLVRAQVEAGAWLILVPACTDTRHGFGRVRVACAARAMENQCFVGLAPMVGEAPWSAALDVNHGHAALFGPIDRGFPEDGVLARGPDDEGAWVFVDADPERLKKVRAEGAVLNHLRWPGPVPRCPVRSPAAWSWRP